MAQLALVVMVVVAVAVLVEMALIAQTPQKAAWAVLVGNHLLLEQLLITPVVAVVAVEQ
jgi:hypothetical protein